MFPADELTVKPNEQAVIYRDHRYFRTLGPGRHDLPRVTRFFLQTRNPRIDVRIIRTDGRRLNGDPISVRSSDGETFKFKPVIDFKVTNPRLTAELPEKEEDRLKTDALLALERVAGLRTNADLFDINMRSDLEAAFKSQLHAYAGAYGIRISDAKLIGNLG
ncbi:MAG: SPFH domain-containing protein [Rhodomicrobiaceae bacterium]